MKDGNFRGKWRVFAPFVMRVLLIALLFLVIPLLFYTYLLYEEEVRVKRSDLQKTLRAIGEGQKALLEERIFLIWQFLDGVDRDKSGLVKLEHLPQGKSGYFSFLDKDALVIGKEISSDRALIYSISKKDLLYQLKQFEDVLQPIEISLYSGATKRGKGDLEAVFEIQGSNFSLVLTASQEEIKTASQKRALIRFLLGLFCLCFLGGALVYLLTKRVARPLKNLFEVLREVSEGQNKVRYRKDFWGFEINAIGNALNEALDARDYHEKMSLQERLAKESLVQEIKVAHEIQKSLLPRSFLETKSLDIEADLLPAKEVGGDFYDFHLLKDGTFFFCIADTAGKGVSSCIYSLTLKSALKALASLNKELSEILIEANNLLFLQEKNTGMFITLWAAIYNPHTYTLEYACQGHVPALLTRKEKVEELKTPGIALGVQKLDAIETKKEMLASGDALLLYTDGVVEAHSVKNALFGIERLKTELLKRGKTPSFLKDLLQEVEIHARGKEQHDDIALLFLKIL